MFYSQFILAKKGPLGTIWIAAHLERKLRKNQVTETNIDMSVDSILFPEVPIALRLSGHLLLGVVRIYSRKVNYLFHDCSEALTKIKQVFHSGIVDLPPEASTAPFHSVTLPESFDLDELELIPAREGFSTQGSVDHYVTTREQITLQDPMEVHAYLASDFDLDERFPDGCAPQINIEFDEEQWSLTRKIASPSSPTLEEDVLPAISADDKIDLDKADDEDVQGPCTPGLAPEAMDLDERSNFTLCQFDRLELGDRLEPSDGMPVLEADYFPLDINEEQNIEGSGGIPGIKGAESKPVTAAQTVPENGLEARDRELQCLPLLETLDAQTQVIQNLPRLDTSHSSVGIQAVLESTEDSVNMRPVSEELFPMHNKDVQPAAEIPDVEKVCSVPDIQPELDLLSRREHSNDDNTIHNADIRFLDTNLDTSQVPDLDLVNPDVMLVEDVMVPHEEGTPFVNDPLGSDLRKLPSPAEADLPGDDDLLATILGRRTPALAVVSTPSEAPAAKRQRTVPKLVTKKRKQALDLSAVLHGDLIRQQLASTDDIRRVRRKAPCTQREIWDAEKEAHGQLIFMEPLIPGMCDKLQKLYHHAPSAGSTKPPLMPTANNIAKDSFVAGEAPTNQMHDKMPSTSVLTDSEKQTLEKDTTENSLSSDEAIMDLEKRNQEEVSHEDHGHLNKNEVATYKNGKEASDSYLQQACVEIQQEAIHDTSASLPGGAIQVEEYMETSEVDRERLPNKEQVVERGDCPSEADTNTKTNGTVQLECQAAQDEIFIYVDHNKPSTDGKLINEIAQADTHTEAVLELGHKAEVQDLFLETVEDKSTDNNMPSGLLEANETTRDEDTGSNMPNEEPTESIAGNEEPKAEDHRIIEQQAHHRDQANNMTILDIDVNLSEEGTLDQNRTTLIENEQSTGLNFLGDKHRADKDIILYDIEDYETEYPEEEPHDKSGWSSRTRAVGQYLKTRFEVLGADCKINYNPELGLDRLLIGKTRREAARMFFETLVLKTKDYINVEQGNSFESIHISARAKLMKAEF